MRAPLRVSGAAVCSQAALSRRIRALPGRKTHLPQISSTPQLGCLYGTNLTCGEVVEVPGIFGYTAAQPKLLASLTELLNVQKFWTNVKYVHPGQHLQAAKDTFFRQTVGPLLCMK